MRIAGLNKLSDFMRKHARARSSLQAWIDFVKETTWSNSQDIKVRFRSADFLSNNRVIFNISGNNYRLVVLVRYHEEQVLILRIGTHAEYNKWKLD